MTHASLNHAVDWSSVDVAELLASSGVDLRSCYITYITAKCKILHRNNIIVISPNRSRPGGSYFRSNVIGPSIRPM